MAEMTGLLGTDPAYEEARRRALAIGSAAPGPLLGATATAQRTTPPAAAAGRSDPTASSYQPYLKPEQESRAKWMGLLGFLQGTRAGGLAGIGAGIEGALEKPDQYRAGKRYENYLDDMLAGDLSDQERQALMARRAGEPYGSTSRPWWSSKAQGTYKYVDKPLQGGQLQRYRVQSASGVEEPWGEPFSRYKEPESTVGDAYRRESTQGRVRAARQRLESLDPQTRTSNLAKAEGSEWGSLETIQGQTIKDALSWYPGESKEEHEAFVRRYIAWAQGIDPDAAPGSAPAGLLGDVSTEDQEVRDLEEQLGGLLAQ